MLQVGSEYHCVAPFLLENEGFRTCHYEKTPFVECHNIYY